MFILSLLFKAVLLSITYFPMSDFSFIYGRRKGVQKTRELFFKNVKFAN